MRVLLKSNLNGSPITVIDSKLSRRGELLLGLNAEQIGKSVRPDKQVYWVEWDMVKIIED